MYERLSRDRDVVLGIGRTAEGNDLVMLIEGNKVREHGAIDALQETSVRLLELLWWKRYGRERFVSALGQRYPP